MENNKYNIQFNDKQRDVIKLLMSLNDHSNFVVKQLSNDIFEITYDGGYNNVYDFKCQLRIVEMTKNIHNKWFYWKFELTSSYHSDYIEVDNMGWSLGFLDFFIDDYIKEVGTIINR